MEIRLKDCNLQCEDQGTLKIGGYVNVTERESEMLYSKKRNKWFKEIMKRGVFQTAIDKAREIPLLLEHDWGKKLANTVEGTLLLKEDNVGLRFDAVIENEEVYELVKSGAINSCSFGFRALEEKIEGVTERLEKRFVSAIELLEVSLVKNPAYIGSLAETRAYEEEISETTETTETVVEEVETEKVEVVTEEVTETIEEVIEQTTETEENSESVEVEETTETEDERSLSEEIIVDEPITKEQVVEIVDELITKKMSEIAVAEVDESNAQETLEEVKNFHDEVEADLETECNIKNYELIKLRLELLKLKELKRGI